MCSVRKGAVAERGGWTDRREKRNAASHAQHSNANMWQAGSLKCYISSCINKSGKKWEGQIDGPVYNAPNRLPLPNYHIDLWVCYLICQKFCCQMQ